MNQSKVKMHSKLLFIILLVLLPSCSIVKRQYGHNPSPKHQQEYPLTNYHQVLDQMGAPDSIAILNDAFIFTYHSVVINEPQFGINIPFFDLIKFNLGNATAKHSYYFYAFNLSGNCINLSRYKWKNELGNGSSIGLIFIVEETVDLTNFKAEHEANLWGKSLLIDKGLAEFSLEEIILGNRIGLIGQSF